MPILISDKIAESAISLLKENQIDFDYQPEIASDRLLTIIPNDEALIVRSRTKVTEEIIAAGKNLKIIGRVGTGVDNIDMTACKARKIIVVNAPDGNSQAVVELIIGLMLSLLRKLDRAFSSMKNGLWLKKELGGRELSGKTVGIVGYGHIGKRMEKLLAAFGAKTLIYSRSHQTGSIEELFKQSDIITIHLALNSETKGIATRDLLTLMKPTAFIVNASRGEIIDEEALYQILINKKIGGAALDVFWQEPLPADSRWRKLDNVVLTPHIGASTKEALEKASITVMNDVINMLKGEKAENQITINS